MNTSKPAFFLRLLRFIAFIWLLGGLAIGAFTYFFVQNAVPREGTVVDVAISYDDDSVTYKPTISYTDMYGGTRTAETFWSSSSYNFNRGDKVRILFDTRNPQRIIMDTWFAVWGLTLSMLSSALIFMIVFSVLARASAAKRGKSSQNDRKRERYVHLESTETAEDHQREIDYRPTVRRMRR